MFIIVERRQRAKQKVSSMWSENNFERGTKHAIARAGIRMIMVAVAKDTWHVIVYIAMCTWPVTVRRSVCILWV